MAEVWEPDYTHRGYWSSPTDWVEGAFITDRVSFPSSREYQGFIRWPGPNVPLDNIESATLTGTRISGSRNMSVSVYRGDAPAPPFDRPDSTNLRLIDTTSGSSFQWDVTDELVDALEGTDWSPGGAIAVHGEPSGFTGTASTWDLELSITYTVPVQYLAPVTVQASVTVGRITPSYAINVATTIDVPVSVGAVDIVAPRTLNARTVYVPLRVNQAQMSGTGQGPTLTMAHTLDLTATIGIALLSVTIPPEPEPEPWERLIQSEEYHEALVAGTLDTDLFVEVIDDSETVLARMGGPDPDYPGLRIGSVTCDGEAAIRWTTEVTVDDPELVPVDPFDLLSPFSYNRLRLWWRIWLPRSQRWGQIPVGTLYPDLPELSDSEEGGLNVTIMASDAVALIKQAVWDVALDLSDMRVHEAIAAILEDRAPWAKWALTPTHYWVSKNFTPGEPNSDPWADIEALADAAGQRAFVDRMGVIRTEPITRPGQPVGTFSEGPGSPMVDLPSMRTDMSRIANKITVTTADPEVDPPPYGYWQDNDPSSPLWVGRGRLFPKIIRNPIVTSNEQAQNYAINEGARRAVTRTVEATILPHPHLNPYDIIELNRERAALSGTHTLVSWTLDFSSRLMSITATNRKEFQEWMTT